MEAEMQVKQVKRLAQELEQDTGKLLSGIRQLDEMKQSVAALERMWEGSGREAFHQTFREDMEAAQNAVAGMKEIYAYDTNAKQQYEQRERKIAALLAQIRG